MTKKQELFGSGTEQLRAMIKGEQSKGNLLDFRMFPSANRDRSPDDVARDAVAMHAEIEAGNCEILLHVGMTQQQAVKA